MRILVADDHTLFREGLRYILKDLSPDIEIAEADTFDEVVKRLAESASFDVLLLDLGMPGFDRQTSLKSVHVSHPSLRIVVLSASEDRTDVRKALAQGAKGYIPKSSSREVMVSALRLVLSGGTYLPSFVIEGAGEGGGNAGGEPDISGLELLTPRQQDVLACLAEGKSNKEIARQLGLAEGTVKIHIAGILKALKVNNRTQAIIAAGKLRQGGSS